MLPHFVGNHDQVVGNRDFRDGGQLVRVEQPSGRIMRIVEYQCAGSWRHRSFQRRPLHPPAWRLQRDFPNHTARPPDERGVGIIGGRHDNDLVTGRNRREDRRRKRFGRAAGHADIVRR